MLNDYSADFVFITSNGSLYRLSLVKIIHRIINNVVSEQKILAIFFHIKFNKRNSYVDNETCERKSNIEYQTK